MDVVPDTQNISKLFSGDEGYHIDFYQREYKWGKETVIRLIDDVFYQFDLAYEKRKALDPSQETITEYGWYYLNTYITNKSGGRVFVVDGQQRLTTITLMLLVLHQMSRTVFELPKRERWLASKIFDVGVGGEERFHLAHGRREPLMSALLKGETPAVGMLDDDITARHMIRNYGYVFDEFRGRLKTEHQFETFVFYFLLRVVIINLDVSQTDVPMVFEAINDRGIRLFPYEIMKGKLLGQIGKEEVNALADIWDTSIHPIAALAKDEDDSPVDDFFRTYFRAWHCSTREQSRRYDGAYHRHVFSPEFSGKEEKKSARGDGAEPGDALVLLGNPEGVKTFLKEPVKYYSSLFLRLRHLAENRSADAPECCYSSKLNAMDGYMMLAVAACAVNDPDEETKIAAVARAYDRAYVMLQLNRAYDSNRFQELLYVLSTALHHCPVEEIGTRIDTEVLKEINSRRNTDRTDLLSYDQFRQVSYGDYNTRFLRYLLARVEMFVAEGLGKALQESLWDYVRGVGRGNAYHVEHILARNDENRALFTNDDGTHDEVLFEDQRNRFGGLLLLKGVDNSSSGNESYANKLRTYIGKAPYWSQALAADFYKSHAAIKDFCTSSGLPFHQVPVFDREALGYRSKLMYQIICRIWGLSAN
jgi:hypothetical protein